MKEETDGGQQQEDNEEHEEEVGDMRHEKDGAEEFENRTE